jgi:hypothetical protein
MAELNFGLLTPPGSQNIGNAFVQGMDQAAVARARENQNALSQYTLGKARREDELTNKMLAGMQSATTLEQQAAVLRSVGRYKDASELINAGLDRQIKQGTLAAQPSTRANIRAQTAVRHGTVMKNEATRVLADPTFDNAMRAVVNFGEATGQDVTQEIATINAMGNDPVKIAKWAKGHAVTGEQLLNQNKPPDVAQLIAYRDSLPPGPDRDAVTAQIESPLNQNRVLNTVKGEFEDRRQQPPGGAPAPSVDAPRQQAIAMDAAGLPVNVQGNALVGAPAPGANNMTGAQPVNPRQRLDAFQSTLKLAETGYRQTPQGNQEFIPGSKADPTAAYRNIVTTAAANDDMAQVKRAQTFPQDFTKIDETLNTLRNTDINTGLGAALFTVLDKARAQVTADTKAGDRAVNTEYLDALLGSAVFPQIQALGIGAKGLDTPAEREFLRKVLTGSIDLTKDTLIKMTELRRKGLVSEAERYNKRVEGGEFKNYAGATGRKVEAFTVPPLPTTEAKRAAPVKISGGAEYDKLPSGTLFMDPEGTLRRKP